MPIKGESIGHSVNSLKQQLVLLSGLPGTGKTRLAIELSTALDIPVLSKDRFQSQLRTMGLAGREGPAGYELLFDQAEQQISLGLGVILDAVFPKSGFRNRARNLADRHDVSFKAIECVCSDETLLRDRVMNREQYVPHWTPVGWEEVERVRAYYQPWRADAALQLDAAAEFGSNVKEALAWIER